MEDLLDLCSAAVGQVAAVWSNVIECDPPSNIDGWVHVLRSAGSHIAPVLTQRLTPALEAARASRQSSSEIPVPQRVTRLMLPAELGSLVPTARCFMQGDEVYSMSEKPRGQCIIINNKKFEDPAKNRDGSEIDVERMEKLFSALYFEVHIGCNLTAAVCLTVQFRKLWCLLRC
ncbi:caspase a-like [Haemaphysalis longicornis]